MQPNDAVAAAAQREHGHLVVYLTRGVGRAPPLADELGREFLPGYSMPNLAHRCKLASVTQHYKIVVTIRQVFFIKLKKIIATYEYICNVIVVITKKKI